MSMFSTIHPTLVVISLLILSSSIFLRQYPEWIKSNYNYIQCLIHPPEGHFLPLSSHQSPENDIHQLYKQNWPDPYNFWKKYTHKSKPVLMKGLAKELPAFRLWNEEYLKKKCGDLNVNVETSLKEERGRPTISIPFSKFIDQISKQQYYMVHSLPVELYGDIIIPIFLKHGLARQALTDLVLWISNGGTKSVLHADSYDNILCMLKGSKKVVLINRTLDNLVELDHPEGLYSSVDVERVDLCKYPGLGVVPWYNVTLEEGDCLYIPFLWFHQVDSSMGFNLAINFWFQHHLWFKDPNLSDGSSNLEEITFNDQELIKLERISMVQGLEILTFKDFQEIFKHLSNAKELYNMIDLNNDAKLTLEEIYSCDAKLFNSYFVNKD